MPKRELPAFNAAPTKNSAASATGNTRIDGSQATTSSSNSSWVDQPQSHNSTNYLPNQVHSTSMGASVADTPRSALQDGLSGYAQAAAAASSSSASSTSMGVPSSRTLPFSRSDDIDDEYIPLTLEEVMLGPEKSLQEREEELYAEIHFGSSWRPGSADDSAAANKVNDKDRKARLNSIGDHRLKISFLDFGVPGESPQTVVFKGKGEALIPDGLKGTTEVYGEQWMFEIHHRRPDHYPRTVLEFSVTNLSTNRTVTRMEVVEEARIRETHAKTICNQVLKQAMELRAQEYEGMLRQTAPSEMSRISSLEARIRALRPKRLLIGPLFFGLQHQALQERMFAKAQQATTKDGNA